MLNEILILIAFIGGYFLCFFTNKSIEYVVAEDAKEHKEKIKIIKAQKAQKKFKGNFIIDEEEETEKDEVLLDIDDAIRYNKEKEKEEEYEE